MQLKILIDTDSRVFRRTFTASLFIFSIILFGAAAYSWTGPTGTAPNSNVAAPINVGATSQVKSGALSVNGLSVYGNEYVSGNLGVGAAPGGTWKINAQGGTYGIYGDATTGQAVRGYVTGAGYGGYFTALTGGGGGGVFAQNSGGYYALLGYPGSTWSVYSNGSTYTASQSRADGGFCIGASCKTTWGWSFGGMYSYDVLTANGSQCVPMYNYCRTNPMTGGYSCPSGYTATPIYQGSNNITIFMCWKAG